MDVDEVDVAINIDPAGHDGGDESMTSTDMPLCVPVIVAVVSLAVTDWVPAVAKRTPPENV